MKLKQIIFQILFRVKNKNKNKNNFSNIEFDVRKIDFIEHNKDGVTLLSNNCFCILNEKGELKEGWTNSDKSKLWNYNLNYFDFLIECNFSITKNHKIHMIEDWISKNNYCSIGWESYPLSLRLVNIIKFMIANKDEKNLNIIDSLHKQSSYLFKNIEYHILGNHLFVNAKALLFAGCYFKSVDSELWFKKGLKIIDKEISEQILSDGGNFELSPMYHNIMLFDMLDIYNLALSYNNKELNERKDSWKLTIEKMLYWSHKMNHPDGNISFFNDSSIGVASCTKTLSEYACKLGIKDKFRQLKNNASNFICTHLDKSGYVIIESEKIKAILDVAKIGPDYIPGHGHADTLSFELSLFGQRVFVNSGTGEYGLSEERLRQRKTAAHNTVEVDGEDSSEVWSGFRVARRAYPSQPVINKSEESILISCSHNGYQRLSGRVTHQRLWKFDDTNLVITDVVSGKYEFAKCYFHIHPDVEVKNINGVITLTLLNGNKFILLSNQSISIEDSTWHPKFGVSIKNKKLVINMDAEETILTIKY